MTRVHGRPGATLVELLVVIAVLGVVLGTVSLAVPPNSRPSSVTEETAIARRTAIREARVVTVSLQASDAGRRVTISAFPTGRVLTDTSTALGRLR